MAKRLLEHRTRSMIIDRNLNWPPTFYSKHIVAFQALDKSNEEERVDFDELIESLQLLYPDYKRQRQSSLKSLLQEIVKERVPFHSVHANTSDQDEPLTKKTKLKQHEKSGAGVMNPLQASKINASDKDEGEYLQGFSFTPEFEIEARLEHIGGIDGIKREIQELVILPLKYPDVYKHLGVQPTRGVLLHGPPGSGKSRLAEAIAGEAGCAFFRVAATEIVTGMSGDSEARLRRLFDQAKQVAPSIIFLDEIDAITPKRENVSRELEKRIVAQLGICMDGLAHHFVIVIGATNRHECLDPMIRRNGRFDREISMGIPDAKSRVSILEAVTSNMRLDVSVDFQEIANLTPGYVGADLQALAREAAMCRIATLFRNTDPGALGSFDLGSVYITHEDFTFAISRIQPSAKREGFATIPDVTWSNIGALGHLQKEMEEHVVNPIRFKRLYKRFGLVVPAGILLYGPPGCGKTLLAKAMANASKANFISIKGPELLNKYVGESERAVRLIFQRAAVSAPCVVFFDEIDSLCPIRSSESNQATERVVNQLLTELDGIQNREHVYVVAATNRPDIIDPAMLRPGRLERLMYVPLPNTEGRLDILQKLTIEIPLDAGIDLKWIAQNTPGYSGADLALLVREAGTAAVSEATMRLMQENTCMHPNVDAPPDACLTMQDFKIAISRTFPSVKQDQINFYESFKRAKS
ncbi:bifunctional ATPase [Babesia duncani]|uniref:Bifunctional ATPase n=1 Tax=Babesia duncani TaxID=323732 RepID=A0AAD9UQC4_9APIC|nr:bifunctional ATPase [Babesia duncani]